MKGSHMKVRGRPMTEDEHVRHLEAERAVRGCIGIALARLWLNENEGRWTV